MRIGLLGWWMLMALLLPNVAMAISTVPTHYGIGINYGFSYDPDESKDFVQATAFALFDYDAVWPHRAPESLRFKVEGSAGGTTEYRAIASANIMALYFVETLRKKHWRPYVEAGIGLIYTDDRVQGQGWRINFNPQAGIGTEWQPTGGTPWFFALRLHHLSNGDLYKENRGINSVVLSAGQFF